MIRIGIVIFPRMEELDFIGPFEVLNYACKKIRPGIMDVKLIAENMEPVEAFNGLRVLPDVTAAECPDLDVLIFPGGQGRTAEMKNPIWQNFIRERKYSLRYICSVCTGAFFLAEAGLLKGRYATTYHTALDELSGYGAFVVRRKVVVDGGIITGAGVSSGLETAIVLLAKLFDINIAQETADRIEYCVDVPALLKQSENI